MTDLWYEDAGSGAPAVLMHQGVVDSWIWDRFLPFVANRLRTIRYDQRGYGRSPMWNRPYSAVDDLVSVLDAVEVDRTALVGTSRGGRIAVAAAIERPERVSALVLIAASVAGHRLVIEGTPEQEARWEAAEASGDAAALAALDMEIWAPMGVDDELRTMFLVNAVVSNADDPVVEQPSIERLAEISIPTLIVTGGNDLAAIHGIADLLAREIPGARRAMIDGADHMVQWRAPQELAQLVLSLLA